MFLLLMYSQIVKLGSLIEEIYCIGKTYIELDKIFDERNIYVLLFNLRYVIHNRSFCKVNLLCYESRSINITLM